MALLGGGSVDAILYFVVGNEIMLAMPLGASLYHVALDVVHRVYLLTSEYAVLGLRQV